MSLKTSIKALVLKRFSVLPAVACSSITAFPSRFMLFYDKTCRTVGSRFSEKKPITLGDRRGWALALRFLLVWGCRLVLTGGEGTLQPFLLIAMGLLAPTLGKVPCVPLSRKLLTALYRKGALTRINFYCTAKTRIFQMLKDIAHSSKRLCLDLNSVTLFMCKNHRGCLKSLWGLLHGCALAPKIQDEI